MAKAGAGGFARMLKARQPHLYGKQDLFQDDD